MADKPYITIAVEPHGEFCNNGLSRAVKSLQCPFLRAGNAMANRITFSCAIFGDLETIGAAPMRMIKRHEGCIEAQKRFEDDERRRT
jgi:hypothetical protein